MVEITFRYWIGGLVEGTRQRQKVECRNRRNKGRRQKAEGRNALSSWSEKKCFYLVLLGVTWCCRVGFRHASGGHFRRSVIVASRANFLV